MAHDDDSCSRVVLILLFGISLRMWENYDFAGGKRINEMKMGKE